MDVNLDFMRVSITPSLDEVMDGAGGDDVAAATLLLADLYLYVVHQPPGNVEL